MKTGRRVFISGTAALLAGAHALLLEGQGRDPNAPQSPFPGPSLPHAGPDDVPLPPRSDPKVQLKEEQKELRRDVDRLLQMVKEFKEESDKTPETDILSLSLVKKAEDIEKLVHQIRDRIRAS